MTDEKGVSPIVATVIIIAATVVATIGVATYIRGVMLGAPAPRLDLAVKLYDNGDKENDYFIIEHAGGDALSLDECDTWIAWVGAPAGASHRFDPTKVKGLTGTIIAGDTKTIRVENTYGLDAGSLYRFWIFHRPSGVRIFDSGPEGIITVRAP